MSIPWTSGLRNEAYDMLCVCHGVELTRDNIPNLNAFLREEFGITHNVRVVGTVLTIPTPGNEKKEPGNRSDLFFLLHKDDVMRLANVKRLEVGIRWWEDIYFNHCEDIYPQAFRDAYPPPK